MSTKMNRLVRWEVGDNPVAFLRNLIVETNQRLVDTRRALHGEMVAQRTLANPERPLDETVRAVLDTIKEAENSPFRDPLCDLSVELALFFDPEDDEHLYGYPYAEKEALREAAVLGAEPFGYWDNTDRPEEVSAEDWADRADIVDRFPRPLGAGCSVIKVDHNDLDSNWSRWSNKDFARTVESLEDPQGFLNIVDRHEASLRDAHARNPEW